MRRLWLAAPLPFAALAALLQAWVSTRHAIGHAALLLVLMVAHALCYARWQPRAPRRILVNEWLARAWFVVYAALLVQARSDAGIVMLGLGATWAGVSGVVHTVLVRSGYRAAENVLQLGVFLLGLTWLMVRVAGP